MQIKFTQWTCLVCEVVARFTDHNPFSRAPYWFTIKTEDVISSTGRPIFDTQVCSIDCLNEAGRKIDEVINKRTSRFISNKKFLEFKICNQCGKFVEIDRFNPSYGGGDPFKGWIEVNSTGKKYDSMDFCSDQCHANYFQSPAEGVFVNFDFKSPSDRARLIDLIGTPDFLEQIKKVKPSINLQGLKPE